MRILYNTLGKAYIAPRMGLHLMAGMALKALTIFNARSLKDFSTWFLSLINSLYEGSPGRGGFTKQSIATCIYSVIRKHTRGRRRKHLLRLYLSKNGRKVFCRNTFQKVGQNFLIDVGHFEIAAA